MYGTCKVCVWPVCRVGVQIPEIPYVLLQVRTVQKYPYVLQCKVRIPVFSHLFSDVHINTTQTPSFWIQSSVRSLSPIVWRTHPYYTKIHLITIIQNIYSITLHIFTLHSVINHHLPQFTSLLMQTHTLRIISTWGKSDKPTMATWSQSEKPMAAWPHINPDRAYRVPRRSFPPQAPRSSSPPQATSTSHPWSFQLPY